MNLLDYPIPELDVTLQEVGRVLQLTLPPDLYLEYKTTLGQQRQLLQDAQQKLACRAAGQENWVTEQFKKALLSCADPLPTSTALPVVLLPTKEKACSQLSRAAALLWAAARLCAEPLLLEGNAAMERTQQSEAFSACRLPGTGQDQFKVYPGSLHAIVTCAAGVFPVDILWCPSPGEPMSACSFTHIYSQLAQVLAQPCAEEHNGALTVCSLSGLERKTWAGIRQQILGQGGVAAEALEVMESAVLALSLEERNAPTDLADILNAVRLGTEEGPCLRYYDKVTNLVVFRDSTAGMLFEHTGVDGMVACLVAKGIYDLSETVDFSQVHGDSPNLNGSVTSVVPMSLTLPLEGVKYQQGSNRKHTYPILSFDLPSYPDVLATLSGHRGLYDAWITFSLQLSLRQTQGESASNHILVTPTHMRHYKHGRCDPTYSLTSHSLRLIDAIASSMSPDNTVQCTSDLLQLFHVAFLEHKALIKNTKNGRGVGPHLAALRRSLPSDNPLKKFFDPFGCPSVYLSGTLLDGVECIVGNVYAQNQLSVTYFGKNDGVRILLNAKGTFTQTLDNLKENMKSNLQLVQLIALRYSIACQMGALECLLQKGQTDKMNGELRYTHSSNISQNNHDFAPNTSPNYTLLIHGGAGEDMMLNPLVVEIIEFALETALTVGSQVLQQGGKSIDAVQRAVEALENCFLFNAGKGSVFNKEGKHELEASIVDGRAMKSGSVACVEHIKNPIKAARSVMDKCQHALLVGQGAEEFWQGQGEKDKPVDSKYFHTYIRHEELTTKFSNNNQKNNHPQTVGAVALDVGQDLAAATSTGGLVGKLKGRVGDTAVVGAGVYADDSLAVSCSGDGDVFLRQSVAQKIASLYHHKGYSLRQACREVMEDNLKGVCAGVIAVDRMGNSVIETNAGVMFVGSMINGIPQVEAFRPIKSVPHALWESDELVAYLHPNPWTPGATILTRKALSGAKSIFNLPLADYMVMLEAAKTVSCLLCQKFAAQRCSLVFYPSQDHPAQIRLLPLHGLSPKWQPHLAADEEFHTCDPGFCTSKSGPKWNSEELTKVQAKIKNCLPTPNAPPCFDFHGDPDHDDLFSRIVRGVQQQWRVWEDSSHVAFLTPYPNTPGCTVIVPRKPLPSDIFSLDNADYKALILATYKVARLIQEGMQARAVAMIFEGFEIDYAHAKLIPLPSAPNDTKLGKIQVESFETYPGYVSSVDGPCADLDNLKTVHTKITQCRPPHSWQLPQSHATTAIKSDWYRNLFQIQNTLFHSTVEYFHSNCQYSYALTPLTTDTISSPMGLGSDSEPVLINLLGHDVYLADSMQFVLEYFLRFQDDLPGAYYISPSFRGEDPDNTHLNQFYHVECELLGNMDNAISIAEGYIAHLTKAMLKKHSDIILKTAGSLSHTAALLSKLEGKNPLPRVTLDEAIPMMTSPDCLEWVQDGQPQFGRKLTRKGEHLLIEKFGGAVWLTEMDHLAVPFYQAYVEGSGRRKAKAADLLIGLGETVGLGERHSSPALVQDSLRHHAVPEDSYKWYISMRQVKPLLTSGWGMGTERFLCWLLQHDDIRDMHIIPRMKGTKYMP